MKIVRIFDGTVREIVPAEVVALGIATCMGDDFAAECVEAPDEVLQNWIYDSAAGTFSEPSSSTASVSVPSLEERTRAIEAAVAALMGV